MDPLRGTPWSTPNTVAGFARGDANAVLVRFARAEFDRLGRGCAVDIGCGAARNAAALVAIGWRVVGIDLSWAMLAAARDRMQGETLADRFVGVLAPMERLPVRNGVCDFVIAHGIWNLARSASQFRGAVAEAARIARPGAALFVFTFSRNTLPADAVPVGGEPFVFTGFSGAPQCFLTIDQLDDELGRAGFRRDEAVPLSEYNRRGPNMLQSSAPVIYEALYRRDR